MKTKNLIAVLILISITGFSQTKNEIKFSDECGTNVFVTTDQIPRPQIKKKTLEKILSTQVKIPELLKKSAGKFYYEETIDCTGKSVDISVLRSAYNKLDEDICKCLKNNITWSPGRQKTSPVNSVFHWIIELKDGRFKILTKY
jgi:hypothetical protein